MKMANRRKAQRREWRDDCAWFRPGDHFRSDHGEETMFRLAITAALAMLPPDASPVTSHPVVLMTSEITDSLMEQIAPRTKAAKSTVVVHDGVLTWFCPVQETCYRACEYTVEKEGEYTVEKE